VKWKERKENPKPFSSLFTPPALLSARLRAEKEGVKAAREAAALRCHWETCQESSWFCVDRGGQMLQHQ